ncbi:hypothetical protein L873DRAFT_1676847 [Choiromyces venosus 120613-1]|uniref:Tc1-like transposase DDE domain-containing protein n=1 Tax=Choiromyces venosus 120613-1 TaxID=1336337 RepID=A0A3N4JT46_9PEZI|nr:hypothetical protein L873DRAFT_1676847 [Choiromyces venosus 120613-1]
MDRPPYSPGLNPIKNYWRTVWARQRIPCNEKELIALAREVWEGLPWRHIYMYINDMPEHITTCLRRNGGPTRW